MERLRFAPFLLCELAFPAASLTPGPKSCWPKDSVPSADGAKCVVPDDWTWRVVPAAPEAPAAGTKPALAATSAVARARIGIPRRRTVMDTPYVRATGLWAHPDAGRVRAWGC